MSDKRCIRDQGFFRYRSETGETGNRDSGIGQ